MTRQNARRGVFGILLICGVLVAASFAGGVHPIGDSLAVFRYWIALGVVGCAVALLTRRTRIVAIGLVIVGFILTPRAAEMLVAGAPDTASYWIYQKNLLHNGRQREAVAQDIITSGADFVTLQEVYRHNRAIIGQLSAQYPFRRDCSFGGRASIAVLSRWPIIEGTTACHLKDGFAVMQVTTPDGPLWVLSVHLRWPYPFPQYKQVPGLLEEISKLDGPKVIGGDFNMVPWSYTMRAIEQASGSMRAGPVVRTLVHETGLLRLPIDHVLVPDGRGILNVRPLLGSDHRGVLMGFNYPSTDASADGG